MTMIFFISLFCALATSATPRIVGGVDAGFIPYQVSLGIEYDGDWSVCGGVLISPNHVLTAAHCVVFKDCSPNADRVFVDAGHKSRNFTLDSTTHQWREANHIYTLTGPNGERYCAGQEFPVGDIALLEIDDGFILTDEIQPATLPFVSAFDLLLANRTLATVSGYGFLEFHDFSVYSEDNPPDSAAISALLPDVLQKVDINLVECKYEYEFDGEPTFVVTVPSSKDTFCAGEWNVENPKDSCQEDSGGPIVVHGSNVLIGLVSYGIGCFGHGFYVDVFQYLGEINTKMANFAATHSTNTSTTVSPCHTLAPTTEATTTEASTTVTSTTVATTTETHTTAAPTTEATTTEATTTVAPTTEATTTEATATEATTTEATTTLAISTTEAPSTTEVLPTTETHPTETPQTSEAETETSSTEVSRDIMAKVAPEAANPESMITQALAPTIVIGLVVVFFCVVLVTGISRLLKRSPPIE